MSLTLLGTNLGSYCLQVALLVAAGLLLPPALGLKLPQPRLKMAQFLLAGVLFLPLLQPWRAVANAPAPPPTTFVQAVAPDGVPAAYALPMQWWYLLFAIIGAGMAARLLWMLLGLLSLGRMAQESNPLEPVPPSVKRCQDLLGVRASFRLSGRIGSPVAFGWRRPVVLLPPLFEALTPESQEGVICHELLHIRRRDWLYILFEEAARVLLWFHPAVWVLLGRIGLAREQAVDLEVIRVTGRKRAYMQALLRLAVQSPKPAVSPALTFVRRGHLLQRVALLSTEVEMTRSRLIIALGTATAVLSLTAALGVTLFPILHARDTMAAQQSTPGSAAQEAAPGVKVPEAGSPDNPPMPKLTNKVMPKFPADAKKSGKTGKVVAQILVSEKGNIEEVKIVKCSDKAFEQPVIDAVKQWKYEPPMKDGKAVRARYSVTVNFRLD